MTEKRSRLDDLEMFEATTREEWRAWLEANHETSTGVWLVTHRKASQKPQLPYEELVEEALCFGWIDGRAGTVDEFRSKLLITPRKAKSGWSRPNKERIERLMAAGRMMPAGLAAIERAKANGTWDALNDVENLVVPDDLSAALDSYPDARANWESFPRSAKRMILEWISTAKRNETRAARVNETARLANENIRANQPQPVRATSADRR